MRAIERNAILALLASIGCAALYMAGAPASAYLSPAYAAGGRLGEWHTIVGVSSNAYLPWRMDPFMAGFVSLLSGGVQAAISVQLFVFAAGSVLLLQAWRRDEGWGGAVAASGCAALLLLYLFGTNAPLLGAISWLPLLVYVQARVLESPTGRPMLLWVALLFIGIRVAKGANYLTPLVLCSATAMAAFLLPRSEEKQTARRSSHLLAAQLVFLLLPYLLLLLEIPHPRWFDYPSSAALVPDNGVPGMSRPHSGWHPPIPVIDRPAVKAMYLASSLCILAICAVAWIASRPASTTLPLGTAAAACVLLDSAPPDTLAQLAPLSVISRMLPGLFLMPLSPFFLALAVLCMLLAAYGSPKRWIYPLAIVSLIWLPGESTLPSRHWGKLEKEVDPTLLGRSDAALFTPSLYVIRTRGTAILDERHRFERPGFGRTTANAPVIHVSSNEESIRNMLDRDGQTRWSASNGGQHGKEWLHVRFAEVKRISGIRMATGAFPTDFPRRLRVRYAEDCPDELRGPGDFARYETAIESLSWQGPVRYTASGLPYLGERSEMRLVLPRAVPARCMAIEQIGSDFFDWSIAELRFAEEQSTGLEDTD